MFEAKVTKNISVGYTIETVIDGKPLWGILFLNKPNSLHLAAQTSSRKRTTGEIGSFIPNGTHPGKLKTPKVLKQDEIKNGQAFHGDSSESNEQCTEAVVALLSSNPTTFDVSVTHKVKLFSLLLLDRVLEADLCSDSNFFFSRNTWQRLINRSFF